METEVGKVAGKIPEIKALPTPAEMAVDMIEDGGKLYNIGTEAQVANRTLIAHDAYRLREELRRGAVAVDLQDVESVQARTLDFLEGCKLAARVPLWGGLCARGFGLSRQFVARWMANHQHHDTSKYLMVVREAFADSLASAALNGSVSPIPAIFSLKSQCGWRDSGAEEDVVEIEDEDTITAEQIKRWLDAYGDEETTEGASGALDDLSNE